MFSRMVCLLELLFLVMYVPISFTLFPCQSSLVGRHSIKGVKPLFHRQLRSCWLPNVNEMDTNKHEMYMADASPNATGLNATYIPPARVGCVGFALGPGGVSDTNMLVSPT